MSRRRRRKQTTSPETLAETTPAPFVRGGNVVPARPGSGRTLPSSWSDFEVGPYVKLPTDEEAVMDGYLMQRYDPTIGAALTLIKHLICKHRGRYVHEHEPAQEFVQTAMEGIETGLRRTMASLMSCLWAGFSVGELIWDTAAQWRIRRIDLLHPLTFWDKWEADPKKKCGIQYDKAAGRVSEVKQMRWETMTDPIVTMPIERVVYWPFGQELREEVVGKRLTDRARRNWYMRAKIEAYEEIFLRRFAHPTPVFRVPKGTQRTESGETVSNAQYYSDFIQQMSPGSGVAIEAGPDDEFSFDMVESRGNSAGVYETAKKYHNAEMFKSMLMSPILLEEPQFGTRAQTGEVLDLFLILNDAIRTELGEVLVHQVAAPMVSYNFGASLPPGEWEFEPVEKDDLEMLSRTLQQLKTAGVVKFSETDERGVREKFAETGIAALDDIPPEERAEAEEASRQIPFGAEPGLRPDEMMV